MPMRFMPKSRSRARAESSNRAVDDSKVTKPECDGASAKQLAADAAEINALIAASADQGAARAIRERRASKGSFIVDVDAPHLKRVSSETREINDLIKLISSGDESVKERLKARRRSSKVLDLRSVEQAQDAALESAAAPSTPAESPEFAAIKKRIHEDRLRRERETAEREAAERLERRAASDEASGAARSAAALVGTAKAASKLAGGTYVPRDEWDAIQKKLRDLEEQLREARHNERQLNEELLKERRAAEGSPKKTASFAQSCASAAASLKRASSGGGLPPLKRSNSSSTVLIVPLEAA